MKNQINEMVTLEWLLPLLNQQLSQVSDGWQLDSDNSNYAEISQQYHQVSGALTMVQLPALANLASKLSLLALAAANNSVDSAHYRIGRLSHKLLQLELNRYVQMGKHSFSLLKKTDDELTEVLLEVGIATGSYAYSVTASVDKENNYDHIINEVDIIVPQIDDIQNLTSQQYEQLLLAWRDKGLQLLDENNNLKPLLNALEKTSQYIWQATADANQQRLWYLTQLWMHDLAQNDTPLPEDYATLLARLEKNIEDSVKQAQDIEQQSNTVDYADDEASADKIESTYEALSLNATNALIVDIYFELSSLKQISDHAKTILLKSSRGTATALHFLPRVMADIETLIFGLDKPHTLLEPLQRIKDQLSRRGWMQYALQVTVILEDIERSLLSESDFAEAQWQIERQLQELYSAIYNTEQAIINKIGSASSFDPMSVASANVKEQTDNINIILPSSDSLRELRIAVEEVKRSFSEYLQKKQTQFLPSKEDFIKIGNAFDDMGLSSVSQVTDKIDALFGELIANDMNSLSWDLTQALAESLTSIELLLDYLVQQIFDEQLLSQAGVYIDKAMELFNVQAQTPITDNDSSFTQKTVTANVLRYDDSGEVEPVNNEIHTEQSSTPLASDSDITIEDDDVMDGINSEANQDDNQIKRDSQIKPDNFDTDEDIRDIFIEEAEEVIANLEDFLSIWSEDRQDLSPLTEVRRSFHTLKGSGRMVGAFSISEMAWAIENLLNRLLDKTILVSGDTVALVSETTERLPVLVTDFASKRAPSFSPADTILQSNNLLKGLPLTQGLRENESERLVTETTHDLIEVSNDNQFSVEDITAENPVLVDAIADSKSESENISDIGTESENKGHINNDAPVSLADIEVPEALIPFIEEAQQLPVDASDADPDIKEIFIEEANEVLEEIIPLFDQWQKSPENLNRLKDIRRGFHTLKGSGRMVGANYSGELAWSVENMLNRIIENNLSTSVEVIQLIADVLSAYPTIVTVFENGDQDYPTIVPLWIACANAFSKELGDQFSYSVLKDNWLSVSEISDEATYVETSSDSEAIVSDSSDTNIDSILQKIYSVNETMAENPVDVTAQSTEEQEFCEIFIDEADTLLDEVREFISTNQNNSEIQVSDSIVRAFHTLRAASGSSALAAISDISAIIEHSLEQLQQRDMPMSSQHLQALNQSVTLIDGYLSNYKESMLQSNISAEEYQSEQELEALQAMLEESDENLVLTDNKLTVSELMAEDIDDLLDAEWQLDVALSHSNDEDIQTYIQQQISQIERLAIKTSASLKFTATLQALYSAYSHLNHHPEQARATDVQNTLLAGHAQLVGLFDALAGSMSLKINEQVIDDLNNISQVQHQDDAFSHEEINAEEVSAVQSSPVSEFKIEAIETDAELLEIFLEEAQELDQAITESFGEWREDIDNIDALKVLQRHLHTIKGGARMAGIRSIGDLTHEAESVYEAFVGHKLAPTAQWLAIMQMVQDTLSLQISYVLDHQESFFATELTEQLQQFEKAEELPASVTLLIPVPKSHIVPEPSISVGQNVEAVEKVSDIERSEIISSETMSSENVSMDSIIEASWVDGLPDLDILDVFLEEADELVNHNGHLQGFINNLNDIESLQALQRDLHTVKGGARMVSANGIADLAHEMGAVFKSFSSRRRPATKKILKLLVICHEWLIDAVYILGQHINPPTPEPLLEALQQFIQNPDDLKEFPTETLSTQFPSILAARQKKKPARTVEDMKEMPPMAGFAEQEQSASSNEMIRISSGLIEHMINLSGESAINRARIDMGMSSLTNSIEEMGTTVQRLADQLRRMEIELEAQILSQIDDELAKNEDFDPLEMDQYSSLNQLSKSLTESASDLIDIKSTLLEKTRDSESLLLQLSRTQTELQDGLMNSRMVPFTRLTPRLERTVRQTANELGKSVELTIINADDEMDRTILERITSPLEHMLRNAVDHGIENTQDRLKAGKDRTGKITLEVLREGSEVVITLNDDGRGIDVEAVRQKAIVQGLIHEQDTSLTDVDIMQYIFHAGLSTTKQVTQISGRGVGMDVVISDIRQLGGVVSVMSEPNQGSSFTIRVPLTVAITDALIVRAADHHYAIPLVQIERVVRINPEKLYDYYQSNSAALSFEENDYRVRYLNEILTGNQLNELIVTSNTSLPVIIIKNRTGQNIALQVDQIVGSRIEVVVKPLGRQISHLQGISAATIMGDGSVMLILDLIALMRNAPTLKNVSQPAQPQRRQVEEKLTILVVDDSVTVRKVTSRFLERQGINVAIAKDGIDAMEILQETTPDLMLLDIEMPRMDGFEVATQVRSNQRLKHIPIIMITSRTGEKHRNRALEIGVNDYMGKPFQENELLDKIQKLLGKKISLNHE